MSSVFAEITELVNAIQIFDTHEHVAGFDWGFTSADAPIGPAHPHLKTLPHVLMNDFPLYIISSTGLESTHLSPDKWEVEQAEEYWNAMQLAPEELRCTAVIASSSEG